MCVCVCVCVCMIESGWGRGLDLEFGRQIDRAPLAAAMRERQGIGFGESVTGP